MTTYMIVRILLDEADYGNSKISVQYVTTDKEDAEQRLKIYRNAKWDSPSEFNLFMEIE